MHTHSHTRQSGNDTYRTRNGRRRAARLLVALITAGLVTMPVAAASQQSRGGWVAGHRRNATATADKTARPERVSQEAGDMRASDVTQKKDITGSWLVRLVNGEGFPFKALFTFGADGTFIGTTEGEVFQNFIISGQHGAWTKITGRHFIMTFMHLDADTTTGESIGFARIRFDINLDFTGSSWTAEWAAEDFDPDGNPVGTDTGTATATRIRAQ